MVIFTELDHTIEFERKHFKKRQSLTNRLIIDDTHAEGKRTGDQTKNLTSGNGDC